MKKFIVALVVIFNLLVIGVAAAGAYVYYTRFLPQPAEFEFLAPITDSTEIEVISVTYLPEDSLELKSLSRIEDTDAFLADFSALECTKGLSGEHLQAVETIKSVKAIKITYADGSYEIITAYWNLDSSLLTPDATIDEIIKKDYYFFDPAEFEALIDKYYAE